jgi:hypothetical protein
VPLLRDDQQGGAVLRYLAVLLAAGVAALVAVHGAGEPGVREIIRWTARTSLLLLCTALAAEGLAIRLPAQVSRSELLRGLALSHAVHGVAEAVLAVLLDGQNLLERGSPVLVLGGGLAYVFIFFGALKPQARLTSVGLVWNWGVFMVSYGTRALRAPVPYGFAVGLLVLAMLVRIVGGLRARAFANGDAG